MKVKACPTDKGGVFIVCDFVILDLDFGFGFGWRRTKAINIGMRNNSHNIIIS